MFGSIERYAFKSDYYGIYEDSYLEDNRTTLMVRNIPNKYSLKLFIETLDNNHFVDTFDFINFPIDLVVNIKLMIQILIHKTINKIMFLNYN